jgi:hypothetical protein
MSNVLTLQVQDKEAKLRKTSQRNNEKKKEKAACFRYSESQFSMV